MFQPTATSRQPKLHSMKINFVSFFSLCTLFTLIKLHQWFLSLKFYNSTNFYGHIINFFLNFYLSQFWSVLSLVHIIQHMWPVTQVNTDLKPPKIVKTEINSLGEKQPTVFTLINKNNSYKFGYSAFNKYKVYNIVVQSFPWFWLFKKVYVSLIFLWHRYT